MRDTLLRHRAEGSPFGSNSNMRKAFVYIPSTGEILGKNGGDCPRPGNHGTSIQIRNDRSPLTTRFSFLAIRRTGRIELPSGAHSDERSDTTGRRSRRTTSSARHAVSKGRCRSRSKGYSHRGHRVRPPDRAHRAFRRFRSSDSPSRENYINFLCRQSLKTRNPVI
jgi:hypothetical protein